MPSINLNLKLVSIVVLVLLLFAGIIALTQELDVDSSESNEEEKQEVTAQTSPVTDEQPHGKPVRWFRSNAGGMALAEMGTRFTALRNEYALSIDFENYTEFPEMLFQYNTGNLTPEIRTLYRKGEVIRTQWILRDKNGTTRINAVIIEPKKAEAQAPAAPEKPAELKAESGGQLADNNERLTISDEQLADNGGQLTGSNGQTTGNEEPPVNNNRRAARRNRQTAVNSGRTANNAEQAAADGAQSEGGEEQAAENPEQIAYNGERAPDDSEQAANGGEQDVKLAEEIPQEKAGNVTHTSQLLGFIEEFDEKAFLTSETRIFQNGSKDRIEYKSKDNLIITSTVFVWDENKKDIAASYTDHYRYNRSLSLRSVEREFLKETKLEAGYFIITFPRRLMDAVNEAFFKSQRQNILPDFFGDVYAQAETRIIYESDDRGRIISQTFYDEDNNVIWIVKNTWSKDRIIATTKIEGDNEFTAQFEYAANGDRIVERNYKNGVLERVVRTEGKTDIEELYFHNILVLRAVWEDGKKISEERVR